MTTSGQDVPDEVIPSLEELTQADADAIKATTTPNAAVPDEATIHLAFKDALRSRLGAGWYTIENAVETFVPIVAQLTAEARAAGRAEASAAIGYETSCVGCANRLDRQYVVDMNTEQRIRAMVAEEIAFALEAEATKRFAIKTSQDYQQMHDAAGGAFNDAADIARDHGKAKP